MNIVIVAKTSLGIHRVCIGGAEAETGECIRLLPPRARHWPQNVPLMIGDVWQVDAARVSELVPPHMEDHRVWNKRRVDCIDDLRGWIVTHCHVWEGGRDSIFDGCLSYSSRGKGYVAEGAIMPIRSVGFWTLPFDIEYHDKVYCRANNTVPLHGSHFAVKYVGLEPPRSRLLAGTLVRLSLARWFAFRDDPTERCWLQLSGWYE